MPKLTIDGVPGIVELDAEPGTPEFDHAVEEIKTKHGMAPETRFAPTPQVEDYLAASAEAEVPDYGGFATPPTAPQLVATAPLDQSVGLPFPGHAPPAPGAQLGGPGGIAGKRLAGARSAQIMPSVGAPLAAVGEALGNIPPAVGEALVSGAVDFASELWQAPERIIPTLAAAAGMTPATPSPPTAADVWAKRGEQFAADVNQLPDIQALENGPGVAGAAGRALTSAARVAPLAVTGPAAAGMYGAGTGIKAAEAAPVEGDTPQQAALRAAAHGATGAAAMSALPGVLHGAAPEAIQAMQGIKGAFAREVASATQFGLVTGIQGAVDKLIDTGDALEAGEAGLKHGLSGAATGVITGLAHLKPRAKPPVHENEPVHATVNEAVPVNTEHMQRVEADIARFKAETEDAEKAKAVTPEPAPEPAPEPTPAPKPEVPEAKQPAPGPEEFPVLTTEGELPSRPLPSEELAKIPDAQGPPGVMPPEEFEQKFGAASIEKPAFAEGVHPDDIATINAAHDAGEVTVDDVRAAGAEVETEAPALPEAGEVPRGEPAPQEIARAAEPVGAPAEPGAAEPAKPPETVAAEVPVKERGVEEKRHLEAVQAARRQYADAGPGEPGVHAAFGIEEAKAQRAHEDATRTPGAPRNSRDTAKDLVDRGRPPEEADRSAELFHAMLERRARVSGKSVAELYKQIGFKPDGTIEMRDDTEDAKTFNQMTPTTEELEKLITPEELPSKGKQRFNVLERAKELLFDKNLADYVAAAQAGRAMRGWYKYSGEVLKKIFGDDFQRFVAVLAATSPRQPVDKNLRMALEVWKTWEEAGRPTDENALYGLFGPTSRKIKHPVTGKMYRPWKIVDMEARGPNTIQALMDPTKRLSGPKVEPFRRNILGDAYPVTNDSWQAQILDMAQSLFSTKYGNIAATHITRKVALELGWEPREAQETMWSFFKTMSELTGTTGDPYETLKHLTHRDIVKNADSFAHLLEDPDVQAALKDLGYDTDNLPKFQHAEKFEPGARVLTEEGAHPEGLESMARRVREVRDQRIDAEAAKAGKRPVYPGAPRLTLFRATPREGITVNYPENQGKYKGGRELERMRATSPDNWTNYSHYYTDEPQTDVEAHMFGGHHIYKADLPLTNEPGGLIDVEFKGKRTYGDLKREGYLGVYYPEHGQVHVLVPQAVDYLGRSATGGKPVQKAPDFLANVKNIGKNVSDAHLDSLDEKTGEGGSTTHPDTGYTLKVGKDDGYVVSPYKKLEMPLDHAPTPMEVNDFARKNYDILHEDPRNQIGTWAPGGDRTEHILDVSRHVDSFEEAMRIGQANDQETYFDVKNHRVIPVTEEPGQTLYQRDEERPTFFSQAIRTIEQKPKGSITHTPDGKALIALGKTADASTFIHEMFHFARQGYAKDLDEADDAHRPELQRTMDILNGWVGAQDHKSWTRAQEEKFARGAELFFRTGDAPTPQIRTAFQTLQQFFRDIYGKIKGSAIDVDWTPEVKDVYRQMLGGEGEPLTADGAIKGSVGAAGRNKPMDEPSIGTKTAMALGGNEMTAVPAPQTSPSNVAETRDILGGYGFNQLARIDPRAEELANRMAGARAKAKHLADIAAPKIADAFGLRGKDVPSGTRQAEMSKFYDALAASRLEGIKDKAGDFTDAIEGMNDSQLRAAIENGNFETLLDALDGRKGFEDRDLADEWAQKIKNIENAQGGLLAHGRENEEGFRAGVDPQDLQDATALARQFLTTTIETWRGGIAGVPELMTGHGLGDRAAFDAYTKTPEFQKALEAYKTTLEAPMRRAHAENEGIFTQRLGPLDTYFPLSNLNEVQEGARTSRTVAYRKPKNANNFFATGLGDYDTGMEALRRNLSRAIAQNGKAGLLSRLQETGVLRPVPKGKGVPSSVVWNGEEYTAKPVEMGVTHMISKDGQVVRVPAQVGVLPDFIHRELAPLLDPPQQASREVKTFKDILGAITIFNMGGPTDAVYHSANLMGTVALKAPFVGTDIISKAASYIPFTRGIAAIANVLALNPGAPEHATRLTEMSELGLLPSRYGESTYSKAYAELTGSHQSKIPFTPQLPWGESTAEHPKDIPILGKTRIRLPIALDFSPLIFGPHGVDVKARILMDILGEKIALASGTPWTPQWRGAWNRQLGNYVHGTEGRLIRGAKTSGWAPFATAGMTMNYNGMVGMLGLGKLPVGEGLKTQALDVHRLPLLTSSVIGMTAFTMLMNKLYRDKWPWEDDEARLWSVALKPEHRDTMLARALYGDDVSKTAYVNLAGFNALMARGARITGVKAGIEGALAGRSAAETTERAEIDMLNGWIHPFAGPPVHTFMNTVAGTETYINRLSANEKPGLQFRPSFTAPLKPGAAGIVQKAGRAVLGANPITRRIEQAHGEGAPAGRVVADTFLPNLLKGPYRANQSQLGVYLTDYAQAHPFAGKPLAAAELQGRDKITGWTSRLRSAYEAKDTERANKIAAEMDAAEQAGTLKAEDRDRLEKNAEMPKNAAAFRRLPLPSAIEAYERANKKEKAELADYLEKKKPPTDLSEEEGAKLLARVDALLEANP